MQCGLAEDSRHAQQATRMGNQSGAGNSSDSQYYVSRRTQENHEPLQGVLRLLPRSLCPVVLLVLLRSGILSVYNRHSDDGRQGTQMFLINCFHHGLVTF